MTEKTLELSGLIQPLKDVYNSISDEWKNFFEIGLDDYLNSQTSKYYYTNTFLHRSEKVKFYDIYYPIKSTYKELTTDFNNLEDIFENYSKIIISGSAGSGKTTLIKHLFLKTLFEKKRIPIIIELRHLNDFEGNIEKLISEKILNNNIKPNSKILKRSLLSGRFVFLFDGYDEIFSHKKNEINRQLEEFIDNYSNNIYIISTRPGSGIEIFNRFYEFKVEKLDNDDVNNFIDKIVDEVERKKRISDIVVDPLNESYLEFLRNPLLLSMFILAFENHPEIPQKKSAFYRNVFDTLYSKHDGITKNSFPREKLTNLQRDDFEEILSIFSYVSSISGYYKFTEELLTDIINKVKTNTSYSFTTIDFIYDLRTSISLLILDGFEYYFPHRSMQEYFTAFFISKLPAEKKKKAYQNMFNVLEESSNDNSYTLWHLCNELDYLAFTELFLLPKLSNLYSKLNVQNTNQRLNNFLEIIKPVYYYQKDNETVEILRMRNFENSFLLFCEVYDYKILMNFPERNNFSMDIIKLIKNYEDGRTIFHITSRTYKLKQILIDNNIDEIIINFTKKIEDKINFLKKDIVKKNTDIDKLLKL